MSVVAQPQDTVVNFFAPMPANEVDFLNRVRDFVAKEVLPSTRKWEENTAFPDDIWPKLGKLGILSMTLPKDMGGMGYSCAAYCEACKEIAKGDPALAMNVAAINALCVGHFPRFATKEQCDKYLPGIVTGEIKLAWGLTEP